MDYEKNLPLPLTGVGQEYYKRQLWIHNFCIHDNVNDRATMFLYAEHYAAKGPNEVISLLDYYISSLPPTIKKVCLFADNCFSQNKNRFLVAHLQTLVNTNVREIQVSYPIPGRSRMPCDRDFGRIEKKRKKTDKVAKPSEYVSLIKNTDKQCPFKVVYVEHPLTDDMEPDGTPVVRVHDYKTTYNPLIKAPTGISTIRGLLFKRGQIPLSRLSMTGGCRENVNILKRRQTSFTEG